MVVRLKSLTDSQPTVTPGFRLYEHGLDSQNTVDPPNHTFDAWY